MTPEPPKPRASPALRKERVLAEVAQALDKLQHGRITVILQDGIPIRVEVTDQRNIQ